jgi:hypothetical protein
MTPTAPKTVVRFLPSLTDVAFLLPIIFQFNELGGATAMLGDGDTGWHLRTGEWILAHGQVPHHDMFSFTRPGQPWYAWEWLWDVTFGLLHQHFGMPAVIAVSVLLLSLTSALLYRLVLRKCGNPLLAIAITGLADACSSIHWLARPHLVTMLFSVIFLHIVDRVYTTEIEGQPTERRLGMPKLLWLLPPLMVLWTNLHGGFVSGLLILGAYAGGGLLSMILSPEIQERGRILARVKPFVLCGGICAIATLANPYFVTLHSHIFKYLGDPYLYEHINEFQAYGFGHASARYVEPLMGLAMAAIYWNICRRRFEYAVLLAGWLHLGLHAQRNIALFSIACAPMVAEAVTIGLRQLDACRVAGWLKLAARKIDALGVEILQTDRIPRFHPVSVASIALLAAILFAPYPPKSFQAAYDAKKYPVEAAKVLERYGDDRIFASDIWGGYLIYRLYPKTKVFIDGRSDFYGSDLEVKYREVVDVKYDWEANLARYGVETVVLSVDCPLATALKENSRWHLVYDDKVAIIFRLANGRRRIQQVSNCPNQGNGEGGGKTCAAASSMGGGELPGSVPSERQHRSGQRPAKAATT